MKIKFTENLDSYSTTPFLILAISPDPSATEDDIVLVEKIMSTGGIYEIVPEHLMHAVGVLSGCGIAYVSQTYMRCACSIDLIIILSSNQVFNIIEALSDGAVKQGVPRNLSYKVAAQTLLGASQMVLQTGEHPAVLKDNVCSPGGTTISGIHELERGGLRYAQKFERIFFIENIN